MGLIRAAKNALGGVMADQWKEYYSCEALPNEVLVRRGRKQTSGRNNRGNDNVISNGSVIAVAEGQCMLLVEQGKIVEFCAEPGEFVFDASTEPSLFTGDLADSIVEVFRTVGKRVTFGGDTAKDQRVYYVNTKEILNNKFGTPTPILFEVVNHRIGMSRTVQVRCNGTYSYTIADPITFFAKVCGNVSGDYTRDQIDGQLKAEFIDALQPAVGELAQQELRPAQLPAKARELKIAMDAQLRQAWLQDRGIALERIALNPISLTDADMKKINELEDAATVGANPYIMAGRMTDATAEAMQTAAGNAAGAMTGFMGMNMASNAGGGFGAAQSFYQMGAQQQAQQPRQPQQPQQTQSAGGWKCACGHMATGKFCPECGSPRPVDTSWKCACGAVNTGKFCPECGAKRPSARKFRCDKCGWQPEDPQNPPKFCPECGDPFNDGDAV